MQICRKNSRFPKNTNHQPSKINLIKLCSGFAIYNRLRISQIF
uniref:Uncharacterized protein n=1 Tax=Meloidogyne enterolobii TaxID=390850 RepID=A0A6V7US51_MELEN|nr:unnamed protein product [Meloidogyne enterolobii]